MDNKNNDNINQRSGMPRLPRSGYWFYGVMLVLLIVATFLFFNQNANSNPLVLSDVLAYLNDESIDVHEVEIAGTTVTMSYTDAQGKDGSITQSVPYEYVDDLVVELQKAEAKGQIEKYNYVEPVDWSAYIYIGFGILSVIVVVILIRNFSKQAKDGNSVFSFGSNRAKRTDPNKAKVKFSDVAGCEEEKEELAEIVDFLKTPKKYLELGAKIPKGALLFGAPGTGKTLLARAVAGEAGVPFFYISGSDFVEMLVGVGASRVRSLFEDAKKAAPSVIFIDEIDAVGRKRGAGLGGGNDEREQTLNQILVEMDGFEVDTNVIVMAATNRSDVLDPALLRPGRFDRSIYVSNPDASEREAILKIHAKGKPLGKDVNLKELGLATTGFTGADLENLLNEAALLTARRNKKQIGQLEVSDAMFRVMMGPEKKSKKVTDGSRKLTAYHEAGHAIIVRAISSTEKVDRVTIIPAGGAGGYTAYSSLEDYSFYTKEMILQSVKIALAGRAAEELFLGDISTGASNDLQRCNKLVRDMIKRYGFSENYANLVFEDDSDEVFIGSTYGRVQGYSDKTAEAIDDEVKKIIASCYEEVKAILLEKKAIVEGLVARLFEKYKVDGAEFEQIYLSNGDLTKLDSTIEVKDESNKVEDSSAEDNSGEDNSAEDKKDLGDKEE